MGRYLLRKVFPYECNYIYLYIHIFNTIDKIYLFYHPEKCTDNNNVITIVTAIDADYAMG